LDKLRIGVIGVGGRGDLSTNWDQDDRRDGRSIITAGADISERHLAEFKERHGGRPFTTTDYRELLDRDDVDAVAVTTPDYYHEEHAVATLNAGKHLFLEKPMAITIEGCDRILSAWKESGKRFMVGFNMRCMGMFRVMKEIVDSGAIGEIKAVWVRHFVGWGGSFYYHDWHAMRKNTTSLLLQKGSHDIDMIHWIAGQYTKRVAAFGSLDWFGGDKPNDLTCPECDIRRTCVEYEAGRRNQCAFRREIDVEDNSVMIMELDNGIKASYLQCHFTPDYHRNYVFIGTEGSIENSEPEMKVWVKTRRSNTYRELADRTYDVRPVRGGHGGADPVICEDFLDMVLDGKEPIATPMAGRMSVAAGVCGAESMRSGGAVVDVPPPQFA
jgi:predicted dehydrogenase